MKVPHTGDFKPQPRPDPVVLPDGSVRIFLTRGQSAIVDAADADLALGFVWYAKCGSNGGGFYAARTDRVSGRKGSPVWLHREVAKRVGIEARYIDHINGNSLDDRRDNLRGATNAQNQHNRGCYKNNRIGIKGVSWSSARSRWNARIAVNGKRLSLGYFDSIDAAKSAYEVAAIELHGEFSNLARRAGRETP